MNELWQPLVLAFRDEAIKNAPVVFGIIVAAFGSVVTAAGIFVKKWLNTRGRALNAEEAQVDIAALAGVRIAEMAAQEASPIRGEAKRELAAGAAEELLRLRGGVELDGDMGEVVQAAFDEDKVRRSMAPDAPTPLETPTAKRHGHGIPKL